MNSCGSGRGVKAAFWWAQWSLCGGPCPQCAVCHPWEARYAPSATMHIRIHAVGGVGIHEEQGLAFSVLLRNLLPSMVPSTLTHSTSLVSR